MHTESMADRKDAFEAFLASAADLPDLQVQSITRVSGGAIQDNYAVRLSWVPYYLG